MRGKQIEIPDEEIFELREKRMTYKQIAEYFINQGIDISIMTISNRCKKIYARKGKEQPTVKRGRKERIADEQKEKIYELREKGMTYKEIIEYFKNNGIQISSSTIKNTCKKIYEEKGKEQPNLTKRIKKISDEEIYELREQGMTQREVAEYYKKQGIEVSDKTIYRRCKIIYKEKGKKQQRVIKPRKKTTYEKISDDEIYELREQEMTQKEIAQYFTNQGKIISEATICKRCKKIYEKNGKKQPTGKKGRKRKMTDEQNEKIYELREQGLMYRKIEEYFCDKGIKISRATIYNICKRRYDEKGKNQPNSRIKNKQTTTSENTAWEELRKLEARKRELIAKKLSSENLLGKAKQLATEKGIKGDDR